MGHEMLVLVGGPHRVGLGSRREGDDGPSFNNAGRCLARLFQTCGRPSEEERATSRVDQSTQTEVN